MPLWVPFVFLVFLFTLILFAGFAIMVVKRQTNKPRLSYTSDPTIVPEPTVQNTLAGAFGLSSTRTYSTTSTPAMPESNFVAQINTITQEMLASDESMRGNVIHLSQDALSGVNITVNDETYSSIADIPQGRAKEVLQGAIQTWNDRRVAGRNQQTNSPQTRSTSSVPAYTPAIIPPSMPLVAPPPEPAPSTVADMFVDTDSASRTGAQEDDTEAITWTKSTQALNDLNATPPAVDIASETSTKTCSVCGNALPDNSRYCPYCGSGVNQVAPACPRCYATVGQGWQYCNRCGSRL